MDLGRKLLCPPLTPLVLPPTPPVFRKEIILTQPMSSHIDQTLFTAEHFEELAQLGAGEGSSYIFKVLHKPTGKLMARKQLPIESDLQKHTQNMREVEISHNCNSPRIVKCYGSHTNGSIVSLYWEVMDGNSLSAIYRKHGRIPENVLAVISVGVLEGLDYLDKLEQKVVHRDVKPQNILVNAKGEVKLCDFGVSRLLKTIHSMANTHIGSQFYMSPERIKGLPASIAGDIWSWGLSLVELATGRYPIPKFDENEDREWMLHDRLSNERLLEMQGPRNDFDVLAQLVAGPAVSVRADYFSMEFKKFIDCCLRSNPQDRPSVAELKRMPFLANVSAESTVLVDWLASKTAAPREAN